MFVEIKKCFFWHDRIVLVKKFVKVCDRCQLAKQTGNMRSRVEGMKDTPMCELFNRMALDITRPLLETFSGNKYVLVAINHYSKWCETRHVKENDVVIIARFLEEEIICRFGVPKYIFTNGSEWMKEFDALCQDYSIINQFTTPAWPQCNGMVEHLIQIIKHGLTILSSTNIQEWHTQLPKILFRYRCGVQANTRYSPYMVLTNVVQTCC